ncbi:hypothetical protein CEXT_98021 [Caerostris extrusa]|uniref:Uncharacterized protein n=1 Tax=Caerostris extrusa TaxID=172846 RepID=A0AAV4U8V1_CAEEX|nr:hypothetical protein CEXT_98021 [Caerostris extrusa]
MHYTSRRRGRKPESQVVRLLPHDPSNCSADGWRLLLLPFKLFILSFLPPTPPSSSRPENGGRKPESQVVRLLPHHPSNCSADSLLTSRCFHSHETFPHAYTIPTPLRNLLLHSPLSTTPDGGFIFFFHLSSSS